MSRLGDTFARLAARGEKALVAYVTAGDPDLPRSREVVRALCAAGVDILELGVPFSDPTADGPVIERACHRALQAGTTLSAVLSLARDIRRETETPIVLFSYYNPIFARGVERFLSEAAEAGADGLLALDCPPEEQDDLSLSRVNGSLDLIRLIAPTTPPERMRAVARDASGFLYLVSMTGVTGAAGLDTEEVARTAGMLRAASALPVCVGFGFSRPEEVRAAAACADGAVVGSAFVRIVEANRDDPRLPERVGELAALLKAATRRP